MLDKRSAALFGNLSPPPLTQNSTLCLRPVDTLQNSARVMRRRQIVELSRNFVYFERKEHYRGFVKLWLGP